MHYVLKGHMFEDEVQSMIQLFFINKSFSVSECIVNDGMCVVSTYKDNCCIADIYDNGVFCFSEREKTHNDDIKEIKRCIKISLYKVFKNITGFEMPWGILTGVRPCKRVHDMQKEGHKSDFIKKTLKEGYFVSDKKISLVMEVAENEKKVLSENNKNKVSVYIGIPFCVSKCLYCSFTSYTVGQYKNKIDDYLKALYKEMEFVSKYIKNKEIESIYVGGGTPTSLSEIQLENLMKNINLFFNKPKEFTVEAGRPDTITKDKLKILKEYGVLRISINPQTMNDKTLELIGRNHTVKQFIDIFEMARSIGHKHINTDVILGLPYEGENETINTFKQLEKLSPESITVHTLAVKRGSRLKEVFNNYKMTDYSTMEKMIDISSRYAEKLKMKPYYMYKQKNMVGNFENVGYCKDNCQCAYNIQIMEERHSVFAVGAGASTKLCIPEENRVERIFNVKSVEDYINRIDEMISRKADGFSEFESSEGNKGYFWR